MSYTIYGEDIDLYKEKCGWIVMAKPNETGCTNLSDKSGKMQIEMFEISDFKFTPFSNNRACNDC